MSEMIERVAEALFDYDQNRLFNSNLLLYGTTDKITWKFVTSKHVVSFIADKYRNDARAVIKAMREPTKEMIEEGAKHVVLCKHANNVWKAMIDKVLEE